MRSKIKYEHKRKLYPFFVEDYEISTIVEVYYKVTPPDDDSWTSPDDYYGYSEVISWDVLSVEDPGGNEVDPEKVLTEGQFLEYIEGLDQFIGD